MNKTPLFLLATCCLFIFSCQKELSVEAGETLEATGTLWDSTGACIGGSVHGTFYGGITPGSDTAFLELQVNVTQTGSYKISSDQQDGFIFSDSGFFSNTGINIIHLKPVGTPIIPTTATFNVSFDTTFCSFFVEIKDSTGTGLGGGTITASGTWQFMTADSSNYAGSIITASQQDSAGLKTIVTLAGGSVTGDTTMLLSFSLSGPITPGTYTLLNNEITFASTDNLPDFSYEANANLPGTDFTITITSYDAATRLMQGTFTGNVQDISGNIVPITNGIIYATVP